MTVFELAFPYSGFKTTSFVLILIKVHLSCSYQDLIGTVATGKKVKKCSTFYA